MRVPPALRWVIVLALLAVGLLLPRWLSDSGGSESPPREPAGDLRIPVRVETASPMPIEERLLANGSVLANERVAVVSELAGKIEQVLFQEGRFVRAGDVLVRLDTSTLVAERDRAAYRYELLQRQEDRQARLLEDGLLSQEDYDFTVGELNVAGAELQLREAVLEKAEIRAPFSGQVGLRLVSPGSFVTSQTRLTTLQDLDPVKIEFSVPESYARLVDIGSSLRFRVQGVDREFAGAVYAREPSIDPETRGLTLRARASNPEGLLLPGAFVEIELSVRESDAALTVPSIAVVPELGGKKIFVLEDGRAEERRVETGIRTDTRVEITRGLDAGETVIVSNITRLMPGAEVVVEEDAVATP